jgi:hypothetical protein
MPPRDPFFIGKNQVTFQRTIFLLLHALCVFLGASVVFSFQFCLVLFAAIKLLDPNKFLLEKLPCFYLPRTLRFSLYSFSRVFSFSRTIFSFRFLPWFMFRSCYIFLSRCIFCLWSILVFIKRVIYKKFEWCWKREKALCKKVVQKGACVHCGLGFCMSCLMSFW